MFCKPQIKRQLRVVPNTGMTRTAHRHTVLRIQDASTLRPANQLVHISRFSSSEHRLPVVSSKHRARLTPHALSQKSRNERASRFVQFFTLLRPLLDWFRRPFQRGAFERFPRLLHLSGLVNEYVRPSPSRSLCPHLRQNSAHGYTFLCDFGC